MGLSDIGRGTLTVGKIYGGILILENWKQTKFGTVDKPLSTKVSLYLRVGYIILEILHRYFSIYRSTNTSLIFIHTYPIHE